VKLELRDLQKPAESLREVLLGFADALREDVARIEEDTPTRIHDIRVATKKVRALLRLAGDLVAEEEGKKFGDILREIRNAFAGSRDQEVMRLRLEELFPLEQAAAAVTLLGLAAEEGPAKPDTARPAELAGELKSRLEQLNLDVLTSEHLVENAASSYRKARKLLQKNRKGPENDLMHEWRKRTKDACYHALALSELKPAEKLADPLDSLAETLGDYHDLALLEERAQNHPHLINVICARKKDLEKKCFKAGQKIFDQPPSEFSRKFRRALK
jgi:CHAD domain-containing protein